MKNPRLFLEIADTPELRELGLMYREKMSKDAGMLFEFPQKMRLSFWMKDTPLPLDIAFLDDDMVVREITDMAPHSTMSTRSSGKYRYALEVNSGWFDRNGISVGTKLCSAKSISFEQGIPTSEQPTQEEPPLQPEPSPQTEQSPREPEQRQPDPDVIVNISFSEAVKFASSNKLAVAFEYEFPEGNINSYVLVPLDEYELKTGREGSLVCGRCVHSGCEYRNFKIDNVIGYDLYMYGGENAGQRVEVPPPNVFPDASDFGIQEARTDAYVKVSSDELNMVKESQSYSPSGQLMMTEYWDDIKKKKGKGKTEGQAILDYLEENSRRNSPQKKKKKKKKK